MPLHKLDLFSFLKLRLVIIVKSKRSYLCYGLDSKGRCRKQRAGAGGVSCGEAAGREGKGSAKQILAWLEVAWLGAGRKESPAAFLRKASVTDTESSSDSMRGKAAKI